MIHDIRDNIRDMLTDGLQTACHTEDDKWPRGLFFSTLSWTFSTQSSPPEPVWEMRVTEDGFKKTKTTSPWHVFRDTDVAAPEHSWFPQNLLSIFVFLK